MNDLSKPMQKYLPTRNLWVDAVCKVLSCGRRVLVEWSIHGQWEWNLYTRGLVEMSDAFRNKPERSVVGVLNVYNNRRLGGPHNSILAADHGSTQNDRTHVVVIYREGEDVFAEVEKL